MNGWTTNCETSCRCRWRLADGRVNEALIDALDKSRFHLLYWESSHRGGLHVYTVPQAEWEMVSELGEVVAESAAE
jgi:hypothetical protein